MKVLETALYAENLEETAAFYADVLGLEEIVRVKGRHVFFRAGDGVFLLFRPSATAEPPPPDARLPVPPPRPRGADGGRLRRPPRGRGDEGRRAGHARRGPLRGPCRA